MVAEYGVPPGEGGRFAFGGLLACAFAAATGLERRRVAKQAGRSVGRVRARAAGARGAAG
ncbi:hypothetical protein GCM10010195_48850 [Kitasatospora griseola]|nr:hypothetical protein GCM10010195_48850 [Kitasatospora griseola]